MLNLLIVDFGIATLYYEYTNGKMIYVLGDN